MRKMHMTYPVTKKEENRIKTNKKNLSVFFWSIIFSVFLLLRDSYSLNINKYIFVMIIILCSVIINPKQLIYLYCFLFPLYVGLPGNYMTLIFLFRLIFEYKKMHFKITSTFFAAAISIFIFLQNYITGYMSITNMMFIPGVILVLILFSYQVNLCRKAIILFYSLGVAVLGLIMLISTLQVYEFSSLLSVSFRLGTSSVDYVSSNVMNVSIDPNFYGLFVIAAIATGIPLVRSKAMLRTDKMLLLSALIISTTVGLVGLSRAFMLVLAIWMLLYLLMQKRIEGFIVVLSAIIIGTVLLFKFMPVVMNTIIDRFKDSDMATANNRLPIIQEHFELWTKNLFFILFGTGLFSNNVHNMPLQFLFGGGIILFALMLGFTISLTRHESRLNFTMEKWLPMIVTLAMVSTVPAAGLLNFMFPVIIVGLNQKILNNELSK